VAEGYSVEISFGIDPLGMIGKVIEAPTGVTACITLKTHRESQGRKRVISSGAQASIHWYSEHAFDEYLDGNYQVSIMFSRSMNITSPSKLKVQSSVHRDIAGGYDDYTVASKELTIKVNV
jgi:hypothetical protein